MDDLEPMGVMRFCFDLDGKPVTPGTQLHVHPDYYWKAGAMGKAERYYGDSVTLRTDNGAVPTIPVSALSWDPHPDTVAQRELEEAGFHQCSGRDIAIWRAARSSPTARG